MKNVFVTPVHRAMPWLTFHYPTFRELVPSFMVKDWEWWLMFGECREYSYAAGRFLDDGSRAVAESLARTDPRIHVVDAPPNKWTMEDCANYPLHGRTETVLYWKLDADEVWTEEKIGRINLMFRDLPNKNVAYFRCRFFVGPDIIVTSRDTWGGAQHYEWKRVFRMEPGQKFGEESPPIIAGCEERAIDKDYTERLGMIFDHFAYATEDQARMKSIRWQQPATLDGWRRLQANTKWPARLIDYFPFVQPETTVDKL